MNSLFSTAVLCALLQLCLSQLDAPRKCPVRHCCELTRGDATSCVNTFEKRPAATTFGYKILPTECLECPPGLCRLRDSAGDSSSCICSYFFTFSPMHRRRCKLSHGAERPESVGKAEIGRPAKCR